MIALTDLLLQERHLLNDEQAEHLQVIQTSGNHLLTVINDILDISKMNHNPRFKLEYRRFSLRKCIKGKIKKKFKKNLKKKKLFCLLVLLLMLKNTLDALNMARHQAASAQHPKLIQIVECPPDISDTIPIPQLIQKLKSIGLLSSPPTFSGYTVLPFIWKIDPEIPDHLTGDTVRLTQILINLCSNATKVNLIKS